MKRSDRIHLINKIKDKMDKIDLPMVDLILKQFNLETWSQWQGGKDAYIIESIQKAGNNELLELAEHFAVEYNGSKNVDTSYWLLTDYKIFISHVSNIKTKAMALKTELNKYNIKSFVAHEDIEPTKEWKKEIENALHTMDALVALITEDFSDSDWTEQEVGFALGAGKLVIPIRAGRDPYGLFGHLQGLQGKGKYPKPLAGEIVDILISNPISSQKYLTHLVDKFKMSDSYNETRETVKLLEKYNHIPEQLMLDILESCDKNRQINGVPDAKPRMEKLFNKFGYTKKEEEESIPFDDIPF